MTKIIQKIKSNIDYICSTYRLFGFHMALTATWYRISHRHIREYYAKLVDATYERLIRDLPYEADAHARLDDANNGPIWVMWWQGLEDPSTPPIVRACVESVRRHANGRNVYLITKDNLKEYINLDQIILDKFGKGDITITMLSDVIRFALLYEYGGMWVDATVYLTDGLDVSIENYQFYTIANKDVTPVRNWTIYFIGGVKKNPLFLLMNQAFVDMYKRVDHVPDYFMSDVMLSAAYTHIPAARKMIDAVPVNNTHRFYLVNHLADRDINLPKDTYVYKLTYKDIGYLDEQDDTAYRRILNGRMG